MTGNLGLKPERKDKIGRGKSFKKNAKPVGRENELEAPQIKGGNVCVGQTNKWLTEKLKGQAPPQNRGASCNIVSV